MKIRSLIAAVGFTLSFHPALAQQDHKAHHPPADPSQVETAAAEDSASMMEKMMQRMEQMQADMDRLAQTQDPAERQKVIQDHRQKMQEFSDMMRSMHGVDRGGMKHGQGMMMGQGKGMKHHDKHMMMMGVMEVYRQMDKRLDLMQAVIENLLLQD